MSNYWVWTRPIAQIKSANKKLHSLAVKPHNIITANITHHTVNNNNKYFASFYQHMHFKYKCHNPGTPQCKVCSCRQAVATSNSSDRDLFVYTSRKCKTQHLCNLGRYQKITELRSHLQLHAVWDHPCLPMYELVRLCRFDNLILWISLCCGQLGLCLTLYCWQQLLS